MTYAERDQILKLIGFSSYKEYLKSELWASIRQRVYSLKGIMCSLCVVETASQLHHASYSEDTLLGINLEEIYPVCGPCHEKVEFTPNGIKKGFESAKLSMDKKNPPTLLISDEASNIPEDKEEWDRLLGLWRERLLMIGPAIPCENFFKTEVDKPTIVEESNSTNKKV